MHTRRFSTLILAVSLLLPSVACAQETSLPTILREHRRALADSAKLYQAETLRLQGETVQQGRRYTFTLFKKAPDRMRYEIEYRDRSYVVLYDGQQGYFWSPDESERQPEVATGIQAQMLRQEAYLAGPLYGAEERGYVVEYVGKVALDGLDGEFFHLRLTAPEREDLVDVYLDSESYLESQREYRPRAEETPLITRFGDYRSVDGYRLPFAVQNFYQGELISETQVSNASVNAGILSFFFRLPEVYR